MTDPLARLFEHLVTRQVLDTWTPDERTADLRDLDPHEAPERLARHLAREFARVLRVLPGDAPALPPGPHSLTRSAPC